MNLYLDELHGKMIRKLFMLELQGPDGAPQTTPIKEQFYEAYGLSFKPARQRSEN